MSFQNRGREHDSPPGRTSTGGDLNFRTPLGQNNRVRRPMSDSIAHRLVTPASGRVSKLPRPPIIFFN